MSGRRTERAVVSTGMNGSTMVYLSMAVVLIVLSAALYTFGIDFGFVHFGGTPNVNILYGGAIACVVLSYIMDVMYLKTIKRFYRTEDNFLTYIPYINFIGVFGKTSIAISWALVAIVAVVAVPAYTPIGQFMPVDYLILISGKSIYVILGAMLVFTILRGYHSSHFKKQADSAYKKEISGEYGSGGTITFVAYIIYFMPIIRSISLFTDLNYINTVKNELDEMYHGEERK